MYDDWASSVERRASSVERQGAELASLIADHWGEDARVVLDAAVGIAHVQRVDGRFIQPVLVGTQ